MLRHIVAWNYKEGFTTSENKENAQKMKSELEALAKSIKGIIKLEVHINMLSSSNRDIVLDSLFESEEALHAYQIHPEHQKIGTYVKTITQDRICVDYLEPQ